MVIQCRSCRGLLRCDPSVANHDRTRRIRCPHCGGEGFVLISGTTVVKEGLEPEWLEAIALNECEDKRLSSHEDDAQEQGILHEPFVEPDLMSDAQMSPPSKSTAGINWLKWILASFTVIVFFALLVNLILPGPTGHKFFGGVTFQDNDKGSGKAFENR